MRLRIRHSTTYRYEGQIAFGLQQLRLTPKSRIGQSVLTWETEITGGTRELDYEDQHANRVTLVSFTSSDLGQLALQTSITTAQQQQMQQQAEAAPGHVLTILNEGEVETADNSGVVGKHAGFAPLWYFERSTPLTRPGAQIRSLAKGLSGDPDESLARCHTLMERISETLTFQAGSTTTVTTSEEALSSGNGVCQDYAHAFISGARYMGLPARYVSGYLMMPNTVAQEATHAWAEAHIPGLGWVGFDPANAMSPDERYVRVATGLDYSEAAPVSGLRDVQGLGESLTVSIEVEELP